MVPYAEIVERLDGIPGVDRVVAWHLIAELGVDMTVFPNADHCASWAGLVPGENESAGQNHSTRCRKGNRELHRVLTQAAWAAARCKKGYLRAFFYRCKGRSGWAKALIAAAHKILEIAYCMLRDGTPYRESRRRLFRQAQSRPYGQTAHHATGSSRLRYQSHTAAVAS